jgi:hypothetical protein
MYLMSFCIGINATLLGTDNLLLAVTVLLQILATFGLIILLERIYIAGEQSDLGVHTLAVQLKFHGGSELAGVVASLRGGDLLVFLDRLPDGEISTLLRGESQLEIGIFNGRDPAPLRSRCSLRGIEERDDRRWLLRLALLDLGPAELRDLGQVLAGKGPA